MSWPFGEQECPHCRFFAALDPPVHDDAGYEILGTCRHSRIQVELFRMQTRRVSGGCPCYTPQPPDPNRPRRTQNH